MMSWLLSFPLLALGAAKFAGVASQAPGDFAEALFVVSPGLFAASVLAGLTRRGWL